MNRKRVHRLCQKESPKVRRTLRKTRAQGSPANACHVRQAEHKYHVSCWDFAFNCTENGTTLNWLSVTDEYTRECLALKTSWSVTSVDVIDTLAELFAMRGVPEAIRSDNGPEFIACGIQDWLGRLQIEGRYIAPGSPWENGYAASFHSKLVDEFLGREQLTKLSQACRLTMAWRED